MFKALILASVLVAGLPYGSKLFGTSISNCGNRATYICRDVNHYEHQKFYQCRDMEMQFCNETNAETNRELSHYQSRGCSITKENFNMPNRWQLTKWYYMPNTCKR